MIKMNLGNASILLNTFPLFVALLAPVLIGERFRRINFIFVIIAFVGVGLIMKPTHHIFHNVSLLGLLSGIFAAFSVISVRRLTLTDSPSVITFYFTLLTTICAIPFAVSEFVMPTNIEWLLLVGIGTAVTVGQLLMAKAYSHAKAATVSPFAYISVIGAYMFGIIIWNDVPDILSIVGGVLIIGCGIAITISEGRVVPQPPA
jgi:drug/metabolite transporter (DMT)-like permease